MLILSMLRKHTQPCWMCNIVCKAHKSELPFRRNSLWAAEKRRRTSPHPDLQDLRLQTAHLNSVLPACRRGRSPDILNSYWSTTVLKIKPPLVKTNLAEREPITPPDVGEGQPGFTPDRQRSATARHSPHAAKTRVSFVITKRKCEVTSACQVCCTYSQPRIRIRLRSAGAGELGKRQPGLPPCPSPEQPASAAGSSILPFPSHAEQLWGEGQKHPQQRRQQQSLHRAGCCTNLTPIQAADHHGQEGSCLLSDLPAVPGYQVSLENVFFPAYLSFHPPLCPTSVSGKSYVDFWDSISGFLGGKLTKAMLQRDSTQLG